MVIQNNITLLVGDDAFSIEKALRSLCAALIKKGTQKEDMQVFYADEADLGEVLTAASTVPFLSSHRGIVLKKIECLGKDAKNSLLRYCENPASFTQLILIAEETLLDKGFYQALSKVTAVKRFKKPYERDLPERLQLMVKQRQKHMTPQARELLITYLNNDLQGLENAVEKLALYVGPRKTIEIEDVEKVVTLDVAFNSFALADAISEKDVGRSLVILHQLIEQGMQSHEIVGLLGWQFSRLKQAKEMMRQRVLQSEIAQQLRINNFFLKRFLRQVSHFTERELAGNLERLSDADRTLKTTHATSPHSLEVLIVGLAAG